MHDNKYMRYFRGHTEEITSLDISPNSDAFLTAAKVHPLKLKAPSGLPSSRRLS